MKVKLAGITSEVGTGTNAPETIAAAYARISRDPRLIAELREDARKDVEAARKINNNVIFGVGHATIAEHVVFNFDVEDISRALVEELERTRLASYTEKSQRYITLQGDFVTPQELESTDQAELAQLILCENELYKLLYQTLIPVVKEEFEIAGKKASDKEIENRAKEDARYVLSMATTAQLGMTINARSLERLLRRLKRVGTLEAGHLATCLYNEAVTYAPSVIKYTKPTANELNMDLRVRNAAATINNTNFMREVKMHLTPTGATPLNEGLEDVVKSYSGTNQDQYVAAALLMSAYCIPWEKAVDLANNNEEVIINAALEGLTEHDTVPREFEIVEFAFDLIVSASCYAQLKRHRICTQIIQPYSLDLGYTLPATFHLTSLVPAVKSLLQEVDTLYNRFYTTYSPRVADYVLTNAHRRRVFLKINLRELYHFSRLRCDSHAQWEIRAIAQRMIKEAKQSVPLSGSLLGGKDQFEDLVAKRIFDKPLPE